MHDLLVFVLPGGTTGGITNFSILTHQLLYYEDTEAKRYKRLSVYH